jgi:GrpB-like predicted nucleotidyltransferase (UPF0157 family)
MKVSLSEYDDRWAAQFADEKVLLEGVLNPAAARIEHIGSTSVPGLAAKPVIDIMIGLENFSLADALVPKIVATGYDYIKEFESEMPYRRYLRKRVDGFDTHHIHMVALDSEFWIRLLLFRDYLRTHPEARDAYAKLKRELAERDWQDVDEYADAKTQFIRGSETAAEEYFSITIPDLEG